MKHTTNLSERLSLSHTTLSKDDRELFSEHRSQQLQQLQLGYSRPRSPTPSHITASSLTADTNLSQILYKCKSYSYNEGLNKQLTSNHHLLNKINDRHYHQLPPLRCCTSSECGQHHVSTIVCDDNVNELAFHFVHEVVLKAVHLLNNELLKNTIELNSNSQHNSSIPSSSTPLKPSSSSLMTTEGVTPSWIQSFSSGFVASSPNTNDTVMNQIFSVSHSTSSLSSIVSKNSHRTSATTTTTTTTNNTGASSTQHLAYKLVSQSILKALKLLEGGSNNNELCAFSDIDTYIQHTTSSPKSTSEILHFASRQQNSQGVTVNHESGLCSTSSMIDSCHTLPLTSDSNATVTDDNIHSTSDRNDVNGDDDVVIISEDEEDPNTECDLSTNSTISLSSYIQPKDMSSSIESDHQECNQSSTEPVQMHSNTSLSKSTKLVSRINKVNHKKLYGYTKSIVLHLIVMLHHILVHPVNI
ncbi:unnamed protein product [Heterobilharzia americana]|nr:unnamed protein product [Heterobilharzia americana]